MGVDAVLLFRIGDGVTEETLLAAVKQSIADGTFPDEDDVSFVELDEHGWHQLKPWPDNFNHGFKVLHGWLAVEPGKVRPQFALDTLREVIDWWATQCGTDEAVLTDDTHWCEDDVNPEGFAIAGPSMARIARDGAGVWIDVATRTADVPSADAECPHCEGYLTLVCARCPDRWEAALGANCDNPRCSGGVEPCTCQAQAAADDPPGTYSKAPGSMFGPALTPAEVLQSMGVKPTGWRILARNSDASWRIEERHCGDEQFATERADYMRTGTGWDTHVVPYWTIVGSAESEGGASAATLPPSTGRGLMGSDAGSGDFQGLYGLHLEAAQTLLGPLMRVLMVAPAPEGLRVLVEGEDVDSEHLLAWPLVREVTDEPV